MRGTIIKGYGGFYYVRDAVSGELVCCRMRGSVRLGGLTPAVGDSVEYIRGLNGEAAVVSINERKSFLLRPPCANVSQSVIVMSFKKPDIELTLLDKLLCDDFSRGLTSVICLNKADLETEENAAEITEIYKSCGYRVIPMSANSDENGEALTRLRELLSGAISVFRGVSGAGKTTLIKKIAPQHISETGEISAKTGRGKNTTRFSELIDIGGNSFILDTPGFSSFTPSAVSPEELWRCYPEFYPFSDCRFINCLHLNEPDCRVKEACERGEISKIRYENYKFIFSELKKSKKNR